MTCSGLIDILIQAQVMILWGFLDALTMVLSPVRLSVGGIMGGLIFGVKVLGILVFIVHPYKIGVSLQKWGPQIREILAESGRHGSPRADTLGKRSHGLQEGF